MFRQGFTAFCMCVCVQSEDMVSMLQSNRLSVDKASSTSTIANVHVTTCTAGHSGSRAKATFQFDGDKSEYGLGPFRSRGKAYNTQFRVNSGADLRNLVVTAQSSDGWCASSILVNGMEMLQGKQWFDKPCSSSSYSGVACSPSLRLKAVPAPPKAKVSVKTCATSHSQSSGQFYIQFDGDNQRRKLGQMKYAAKTYTFYVEHDVAADPKKFTVSTDQTDGLCATSIVVNDQEAMRRGSIWIDNPCSSYHYDGTSCQPSYTFDVMAPPAPKTSVSVTTCATSHSQSSGQFYIQFDGDSQKHKLGRMKYAKKTYTTEVYHDAAADLLKFTVSTQQSDGICATSIVVNGQEAMGQGSIWVDSPCTTYHYDGTSCHPSYTYDLTPPPIEVALPEFDLNEGNACKQNYNFIRSKDDCERAAKVVKFAGELGTFMAKEREVTNRPSGCYMQTNAKQAFSYRRIIYNTHETGAANVQAMIICKKA